MKEMKWKKIKIKEEKLNKKLKNKQGITLIALVLTIIILLILAGVTLVAISGDNGILLQAKKAKESTEEAQEKENISLRETELEILYKDLPKDDDADTSLKTFIAKYKIESNNQTISFPLYGNSENLIIDYGDGTQEEKSGYIDKNSIKHTYTSQGEYEVKITGICSSFSYFLYPTDNDKIIGLIQWGTVFNNISFTDCINLTGNIPSPTTNTMKNIIDVSRMFKNTAITGQIPPYLFYGGENLETAYECFMGCKNLESLIPKTLFKDMKNLKQIHNMFSDSGVIGNIPEELLTNNIELNKIDYLFSGCNGIIGNVPGNLFSKNTNITSFRGVFRGCNITSIDENLFSNNVSATDFVNVFRECKKLRNIPNTLFANNTEALQFNDCFRECVSLETLPSDLFANNTKATNFTETFYDCINLQGNAINLWETNLNAVGTQCFYNCGKLNNYNSILTDWK